MIDIHRMVNFTHHVLLHEKLYMYANIFLNHIKEYRRPLLWTVIVSQSHPRNTTRMIHKIENYDQSMIY